MLIGFECNMSDSKTHAFSHCTVYSTSCSPGRDRCQDQVLLFLMCPTACPSAVAFFPFGSSITVWLMQVREGVPQLPTERALPGGSSANICRKPYLCK